MTRTCRFQDHDIPGLQLCIWNQWKERTSYIATKLCTHTCNLTRMYSGNGLSLYCYTSHAIMTAVWICAWRLNQFLMYSTFTMSNLSAIYPCRTNLQRFFLFVLHLNLTSIRELRLGPSNYQANLLHNSSNTCDECIPAMDWGDVRHCPFFIPGWISPALNNWNYPSSRYTNCIVHSNFELFSWNWQ